VEEYLELKSDVKRQEALLNRVTEVVPAVCFVARPPTRIALTGAVRSRSGANLKGTQEFKRSLPHSLREVTSW